MCFLSIFERLHLMRLRATILSVFCLISSPVDCCLFAESPVDWLFIDCDNRMLCQAKRQKSSAHMALQEWAGRVELPYKDWRNRTKSESVCSVVGLLGCVCVLQASLFHGLLREARPTRWVTPRGRPRPRTSGCDISQWIVRDVITCFTDTFRIRLIVYRLSMTKMMLLTQ